MRLNLLYLLLIKVLVEVSDKRPVISSLQFAQLPGGSRELATGKQGKGSGYYVSRDPRVPVAIGGSPEKIGSLMDPHAVVSHIEQTKGIAEKVVPTGWMTGRAATPEESANVHQGIWQNEKTKETHLDISDRIGKRASTSSLETALKRGIDQHQLGIYAAGTGKTLTTHFEDDNKVKTVNPAAELTLKYLKNQREKSTKRKNMSKNVKEQEKNDALAAFDRAFPKRTEQ